MPTNCLQNARREPPKKLSKSSQKLSKSSQKLPKALESPSGALKAVQNCSLRGYPIVPRKLAFSGGLKGPPQRRAAALPRESLTGRWSTPTTGALSKATPRAAKRRVLWRSVAYYEVPLKTIYGSRNRTHTHALKAVQNCLQKARREPPKKLSKSSQKLSTIDER